MKFLKSRLIAFAVSLAVCIALLGIYSVTFAENIINNKSTNISANIGIGQSPEEIPTYVDNELIVKFRPGVKELNQNNILKKNGIDEIEEKFSNGSKLIKLENNENVEDMVKKLKKNFSVQYVHPNYVLNLSSLTNDPYLSGQWGLHNIAQRKGVLDSVSNVDIDAPEAWDINMGSPNVIVAVIDTGVDITHPDIAKNIWTNPGEVPNNGIDDDGNGYIDDVHGWDFYNNENTVYHKEYIGGFHGDYDINAHGTAVAGIIAAQANNNIGMAGVAPNVRIMPLSVGRPGGGITLSGILEAMDYAKKMGAQIINASWGMYHDAPILKDAISKYPGLFVTAAGNDGLSIDDSPFYPAGYRLSNVISVNAIDNKGEFPSWSNYSKNKVDVAAPGWQILSIYSDPNKPYNYYPLGTSLSAPFVTGTAALMLSETPSLSPSKVIEMIKGSVKLFPSLPSKNDTGGMVDAYNALIAAKIPDTPQDLTATPVNKSVTLIWAANKEFDVAGYNIYRDGAKVNSAPVTDIIFKDSDLVNGITYKYSISAVDKFGFESVRTSYLEITPKDVGVNPTLRTDGKSVAKNGDMAIFGGTISPDARIISAKLEQFDSNTKSINGADIDVTDFIKKAGEELIGSYTVSSFNSSATFVRLNITISINNIMSTVSSNLLKVDNSKFTASIVYSKSSPVTAGHLTITANFNKKVVGTPTIDVDIPAGTDITEAEMTSTSDAKVWKYIINIESGEGTAKVSIHALDESLNSNIILSNNTFLVDTSIPTIVSVVPDNNSENLATDKKIYIKFNKNIRIVNLGLIKFLWPDGDTGSFSGLVQGNTLTITPFYAYGKTHSLTIPAKAIKDNSDNYLDKDYTFKFTTASISDTTPPTAISVEPRNGQTEVKPYDRIKVVFSEKITLVSRDEMWGKVAVLDPSGQRVHAGWSTNNNILEIRLNPDKIKGNTKYKVVIPAHTLMDMSMNETIQDFNYEFITAETDIFAPEILNVSPRNGELIDAGNKVQIYFDEAVEPGSTYQSISIKDASGKIMPITKSIGTFDQYDNLVLKNQLTLLLDQNAHFESQDTYTVCIPAGAVKDKFGNAFTTTYTYSFSRADIIPPKVVSTSPSVQAIYSVPLNQAFTYTFDENIFVSKAYDSISIKDAKNNTIPVTKSINAKILTISPTVKLANNTYYTLTIPTDAIKDAAGNDSRFDISTNFKTELGTVGEGPVVIRVSANSLDGGITNISPDSFALINVYFNKSIQYGSYYTVPVKDSTGTRLGIFAYSSEVNADRILISIQPHVLKYNSTYTVTIPARSVKDAYNVELAADYTFTFTTSSAPLSITNSDPANNSTNILVNKAVVINFNNQLQAGSNYTSITFKNSSGNEISYTKSINGNSLILAPTTNLSNNTNYKINLPVNSLKDASGVGLVTAQNISFITALGSDVIGPKVASTDPLSNSENVTLLRNINVTLNKFVQQDSAFNDIILKDVKGNLVAVNRSLNQNMVISLTPLNKLAGNTTYTLIVPRNSVKDANGINLINDFIMSFTTAADDTIPPTLTNTSPRNGEIATTASIVSLYFSEDVYAGSAYDNITIADTSGKIVAVTKTIGLVDYRGEVTSKNLVTVKATNWFVSGATYTVTIPAGAVKDASGNALANSTTLKFSLKDYEAPKRISTSPDISSKLGITQPIVITYDENIQSKNTSDASTGIGTGFDNISLTDYSGNAVPVTKTVSGNTLTITPSIALAYNQSYKLKIPAYSIQDLFGNTRQLDDLISLKTDYAPDNITLEVIDPSSNVSVGNIRPAPYQSLTVTFNKLVQPGTDIGKVTMRYGDTNPISIGANAYGDHILLNLGNTLKASTTYTVTIPAGSIRDAIGNSLRSDFTFTFTTLPY